MDLVTVGIDPGGRESGLIARRGPNLLAAEIIRRDGEGKLPDAAYLNEVIDAVADVVAAHSEDRRPLIAVEGVNEPSWYLNGQVSPANVGGLMATCMVLGAVLAVFPDAVVVRPARHGQMALSAYPDGLHPTRGSGKGKDRLRHARSAWDIAQYGLFAGLGQ